MCCYRSVLCKLLPKAAYIVLCFASASVRRFHLSAVIGLTPQCPEFGPCCWNNEHAKVSY